MDKAAESAAKGGAGFVPRVSLSLLRIAPFNVDAKKASSPEASREADAASRILSLSRRLPAGSLLRRSHLVDDATSTSASDETRAVSSEPSALCDLTAAPGVVSLKPMEVAPRQPLKSRRAQQLLGGDSIREAAVAEKEFGEEREPPRVTDLLVNHATEDKLFAPPVDAEVLSKQERLRRKLAQQQRLDKWFGMPATEISPQLLRELQIMQLQRHSDGKNFSRSGQLDFLKPKAKKGGGGKAGAPSSSDGVFSAHLQVARVVDGGLRAVGEGKESQAAGCVNKGSRRRGGGGSLLQSFLDSSKVTQWTKKKYKEIQKQKQAPGKSGWKVERAKRKKY